jgi:site-specific recombinase XerD
MMHVLRHTFASSCLSEGISVGAVAEAMGDTEATVQATYSHLMPDDTDRMRKAIGRFFTRPVADEAESAGQS